MKQVSAHQTHSKTAKSTAGNICWLRKKIIPLSSQYSSFTPEEKLSRARASLGSSQPLYRRDLQHESAVFCARSNEI